MNVGTLYAGAAGGLLSIKGYGSINRDHTNSHVSTNGSSYTGCAYDTVVISNTAGTEAKRAEFINNVLKYEEKYGTSYNAVFDNRNSKGINPRVPLLTIDVQADGVNGSVSDGTTCTVSDFPSRFGFENRANIYGDSKYYVWGFITAGVTVSDGLGNTAAYNRNDLPDDFIRDLYTQLGGGNKSFTFDGTSWKCDGTDVSGIMNKLAGSGINLTGMTSFTCNLSAQYAARFDGYCLQGNSTNASLTLDSSSLDPLKAKDGEKYTFDGTNWVNKNNIPVDLNDEGVTLPNGFTPYRGMYFTVTNKPGIGKGDITGTLDIFSSGVNGFRVDYDGLYYTDELVLQVNSRSKDAVLFTFDYNGNGLGDLERDLNCTQKGLGIDKLTLLTQPEANKAIDRLDWAINKTSMIRAAFGAAQNRLEHKIDNLNNTNENITRAESGIRDTDMAAEMMEFTKHRILANSSQSMLAQANFLPQSVTSLLGA